MPISRVRKKNKDAYAPPQTQAFKIDMRAGRSWVAPTMLALFAIGLTWIVVYYVTTASLPVAALGDWNIVVGFGFIAVGFVVSTQWK